MSGCDSRGFVNMCPVFGRLVSSICYLVNVTKVSGLPFFCIMPCSHAVSLVASVDFFEASLHILTYIYIQDPADPTRKAQLHRPVAVANLCH